MKVGSGEHEGYVKGKRDYWRTRPEKSNGLGGSCSVECPTGGTEKNFYARYFDLIRVLSRLIRKFLMATPGPRPIVHVECNRTVFKRIALTAPHFCAQSVCAEIEGNPSSQVNQRMRKESQSPPVNVIITALHFRCSCVLCRQVHSQTT